MSYRSIVGLGGSMWLPIWLGFLWWCGAVAGYVDPWSIFVIVPLLFVLGIPGGFALGWYGMAVLQGFAEEGETRVRTQEEKDDERQRNG